VCGSRPRRRRQGGSASLVGRVAVYCAEKGVGDRPARRLPGEPADLHAAGVRGIGVNFVRRLADPKPDGYITWGSGMGERARQGTDDCDRRFG
jgi:hypothetical protein